jgi:hypothetical protein
VPADNIELRNQKNPRDEISQENVRACDRYPSVAPWKRHACERGHNGRNAQEREGDRERESTLCPSGGQVRKDDDILVSRLGQRSLDRMLPIPLPINLACRAGSAHGTTASVDPGSLGGEGQSNADPIRDAAAAE